MMKHASHFHHPPHSHNYGTVYMWSSGHNCMGENSQNKHCTVQPT